MLFHASIPAADPARAAAAIAELWHGVAHPFVPLPGAWIVFAEDGRGTALEIVPADAGMVPGETEAAFAPAGDHGPTGVHVAIGVPHDIEKTLAIATRQGWRARVCDRGGMFRVIEIWIDDRLMVEALTPEMQREYRASASADNWAKTFGLPQAA